jgi:hypothetical protein
MQAQLESHLLKGVVELLGEGLEEVVVLLVGHVAGSAHPDGLGVVNELPLLLGLLDLLGLGLVVLLLVLVLIDVGHVNLYT